MKDFLNKIICGDCLSVMKDISDKSIDLTVTSPPYDNLRDYENDWTFDFEGIARELFRVTKDGGVVVWVVGDAVINGSETGTSFRQALKFIEIGFSLNDTMIYQKEKSIYPESVRYKQIFEYMFILSTGKPKTVNLIKDKPNIHKNLNSTTNRLKDGSLVKIKSVTLGEYQSRSNIWTYGTGYMKSTKDVIAFNHPATFPEKLASDHIKSWSNENDIILDPMCGSGTTAKMAQKLNRNFIGIEINPDYCKIAGDRLAQTELFTPELEVQYKQSELSI